MPKTYPKTQRKKTKPRKPQPKTPAKTVSITTRKSYWITLTLITIIFVSLYGYLMNIALQRMAMMLVTVLLLIGFVAYIRLNSSTMPTTNRATFIFVGASIIGFSIWAVIVLLLNATGLHPQVANAIGDDFFAITSLIICLISGAFIGDLIGKNKERISIFVNNKLRK